MASILGNLYTNQTDFNLEFINSFPKFDSRLDTLSAFSPDVDRHLREVASKLVYEYFENYEFILDDDAQAIKFLKKEIYKSWVEAQYPLANLFQNLALDANDVNQFFANTTDNTRHLLRDTQMNANSSDQTATPPQSFANNLDNFVSQKSKANSDSHGDVDETETFSETKSTLGDITVQMKNFFELFETGIIDRLLIKRVGKCFLNVFEGEK